MANRKRLKILFIPAWYPTNKQNLVAGGGFIKEYAKSVSLYNDVIVLYGENINRLIKKCNEIEDYIEDDIRILTVPYRKPLIPKVYYFFYLWSIFKGFRKLMNEGWKPHVRQAHVYLAGVPAVILGKIYKIPVVITEHWSAFPLYILDMLNILAARFAMKRAKIILPVSKYLEKAIKSYNIENKFTVVPNVVNIKMFYPSSSQNMNKKKRILLVCSLSPLKGISYLLQALDQLIRKRQDFTLDIVGDGLNREEYELLSRNLGLDKIVKFHGYKNKSEVAEFMRKCDFYIHPSLIETFSVSCIEAMACGKPIVATKIPVLQEKINKDRGILFPPKDIGSLVKATNYMLDHYRDYSPEEISRYAKENFSYEIVGKRLDKIYRRII